MNKYWRYTLSILSDVVSYQKSLETLIYIIRGKTTY